MPVEEKDKKAFRDGVIDGNAHLAAIVESSDDAIVSKTLDGTIRTWNKSAERIFGYRSDEIIGRSILTIIPPELRHEEADIIAQVSAGHRVEPFDTLRLTKDGARIPVSLSVSPIRDRTGQIVGASKIARDISRQLEQQEYIRLLAREAEHRTRNLLSVVQAIARQTATTAPGEFLERFNGRLQALAACQEVLAGARWKNIDLAELLASQIAHFGEGDGARFRLDGQPIKLSAEAAQMIALAVYELATNAAKYGALSNRTGVVDIRWRVSPTEADKPRLHFVWRESGGPLVARQPERQGFGARVTGSTLERGLDANIIASFAPSGLIWTLDCPLEKLVGRPL